MRRQGNGNPLGRSNWLNARRRLARSSAARRPMYGGLLPGVNWRERRPALAGEGAAPEEGAARDDAPEGGSAAGPVDLAVPARRARAGRLRQ
ncbi:hypothetical protein ACMHYB_11940 [Sorangium sp. So ce1128]